MTIPEDIWRRAERDMARRLRARLIRNGTIKPALVHHSRPRPSRDQLLEK